MRSVHTFSKGEKAAIYKMALSFVKQYRDNYAEYERECQAELAFGFTPHHCEHGTDQWTDYDNICGGCENGLTLAYGPWKYERALAEAKARYVRSCQYGITADALQRAGNVDE